MRTDRWTDRKTDGREDITNLRRRGADKYLARPTSRCRRAESIVSLEREVCLCAELQVFLLQKLKGSM